ncbi:hypothetical protein NUW58_g10601 [Xylaria curta]|uniref:Uncharacterized protein n=1 Tax=Xylaria curta TaxID=42375 RepID=A0ACC1MI49_9PEZI|nr:hypothetical protein NUW58_g10601 [Xylaria curta]
MRDVVLDVECSFTGPVDPENDISSDQEVLEDDIEDFKRSPPHHQEQASKAHQPMFQKAPHFKPAEIPEGRLAAELRDWLVDVEAGTSYGSTGPTANHNEEWVARIRVDSLHGANRSARGMTLVLGRQVLNGRKSASGDGGVDESEEAAEILATNTVRLILAGPRSTQRPRCRESCGAGRVTLHRAANVGGRFGWPWALGSCLRLGCVALRDRLKHSPTSSQL